MECMGFRTCHGAAREGLGEEVQSKGMSLLASLEARKSARHIWAENAFVLPSLLSMSRSGDRISAKSFELIRTLGIENRVGIEWINRRGSSFQEFWLARVPGFLQQLGRSYECEIKVHEYDCLQNFWVIEGSIPPELEVMKCMILSKTIYSWLTRLPNNKMRLTTDGADAINKDPHGPCVVGSPSIRRCLKLPETLLRSS